MRRRRSPIASLLRMVSRPQAEKQWRVRCRDQHGRRATLLVQLGDDGVELQASAPGRLTFALLDVGRLRVALREAAVEYSELRSLETRVRHEPEARDRAA